MKFNGWSSKFDETLPISSPRIAHHKTFAKKLFFASGNSTEETVDDSNDHFLVLDNRVTYGIVR